jgi:hypothetical protein
MESLRVPTPAHLLSYMIGAGESVASFTGPGPLNTDDNARIEHEAPRGLWRDHSNELLRLLHAWKVDPWEFVARSTGSETAFESNRRLLGLILADRERIVGSLGEASAERRRFLEQILRRNPFDALARRELNAMGPSGR